MMGMLKLLRILMLLLYRVEVRDSNNNFAAAGKSALLVINAGSLLDPILIGAMLRERVTIVVDRNLTRKWWMRPVLALTDIIEADFSSRTSTLSLVRLIKTQRRCMVFHEASFQHDQRFMRILEATALIAEKAGAVLLPVRIDGAAYSRFSYFRHRTRLRWFPKIALTVLPPQKLEYPRSLPPRERRRHASIQLYKVMMDLLFHSTDIDHTLIQRLNDMCAIHGRRYIILEDHEHKRLSYGALLTKANILGRAFIRLFPGEGRVGLMLPNSLAAVAGFSALHVAGKVPGMINFSAGVAPVISGCHTVELRSVLTSRRFIDAAELGSLEKALLEAGLRLVYLEDVAANLTMGEKLRGALAGLLRLSPKASADEPLALLFTSGTEGLPKAVFLSHRNVNANREQLLCTLTITPGDRFFNALPMFHSFGLGVGTLLPLCSGIRCVLYPSPLHYRIVPQIFYESMCTVICGTDTFFAGYARYGSPYDFFNARLAFCGAEKMRISTAKAWWDKYRVKMVEGYGATESSPVISVNSPANTRVDSVGRVLPGIEYTVKPVPGLSSVSSVSGADSRADEGVLWVKGANVMLGYMRADNPGALEPALDPALREEDRVGWYETGDIVRVDAEDFVYIQGRAKRFAKVGGEMISLAAVENALREMWPETLLGVVAVPDDRKGEQLALIVEKEQVNAGSIAAHFASCGISPLWTPKRIICVKNAPLLGAGKFDYRSAKELVMEELR